jgi:hypothetical protein
VAGKHALIFVHGMGIDNSSTAKPKNDPFNGHREYEMLWKGISEEYCQRHTISKKKFEQLFEPVCVHWGTVTLAAKETVFKKAFPSLEMKDLSAGNAIWNPASTIPSFIVLYLGDVVAYVTDNDNDIRRDFWKAIEPYVLGQNKKYSFIAHSLGSIITFDYLYKLMKKGEVFLSKEKEVEGYKDNIDQLKGSFCNLFTFGSPIGLFMLRQSSLWRNDKNFAELVNPVQGPECNWLNFYDTEDPIAFPLENLFANSNIQTGRLKDIKVSTGWYHDSHTNYWKNKQVAQEIAKALPDFQE